MAGLIKAIANPLFSVKDPSALQTWAGMVRDRLNALSVWPLLDFKIFKDVPLSGSTVTLSTQFGRVYLGYFVVRANNTLQVWDTSAANPSPANQNQLVLNFSGSATLATFWVF